MGVFDWFRRNSTEETAQEPGSPEPEQAGSVGTLVDERPATACCVPAQDSGPCCGGKDAADTGPEAAGGASTATLPTVPQPAGSGLESEGEQDMGLLDTIKEKLAPHGDKVDQGVDKAADMVDDKTGGKHSDKIDGAAEHAKGALGAKDEAEPPAAPEAAPEAAPPAAEAPPEQNPPA